MNDSLNKENSKKEEILQKSIYNLQTKNQIETIELINLESQQVKKLLVYMILKIMD